MRLKPCPFCGGVAFITTGSSIALLWEQKVMCCECGLNIVRGGISPSHAKEKVIEAWNRREPIDRIVEQLEKERGIAFVTLANTGNKELDFTYQNVVAYMDKAIEMVKKGGA